MHGVRFTPSATATSALLHTWVQSWYQPISKFEIFGKWCIRNYRLRVLLQLLPVKMNVIISDGVNKRRELSVSLLDLCKFDYSVAPCTMHSTGHKEYNEE